MTLKECYRILGVARTARVDDVKRAYRRRAFELHPDLNPHLVDANRQFQLLNEAYVSLMRVLPEQETREGTRTQDAKHEEKTNGQPTSDEAESEARDAADDKNKRAKAEDKAEKKAQDRASDRAKTYSQRPHSGHAWGEPSDHTSASAGRASDTSEPGSADSAKGSEGSKASHTTDDTATHTATGATDEAPGTSSTDADARQRRMADAAYTQREDVLHDILNDQFARRVFEDIYSELNKKRPAAPKDKAPEKKPLPPPQKRKLNLEWGDKIFKLDLTHGLGGVMRSWLRKQIDDTLTVRLPAAKLFAGARVRLQIRQGLSQELRVVEITLPPDFKTGKPIRLKGMGRKIGKWTGDLYLTIEAAQ